jgi:hypothetical protein
VWTLKFFAFKRRHLNGRGRTNSWNSKMKKFKKYLFIIVGISVIMLSIIWVARKITNLASSIDAESTAVDSIPNEYLNLFIQKDSAISGTYVIYKNFRYPISDFLYESKYCIIVTKIKTLRPSVQLPVVQLDPNENEESYYGTFDGFKACTSEINYREHPIIASNILLHLKGDTIKQILKTNNCIEFYSKMDSFSLKYKKDGPVDFYIEDDALQEKQPAILIFLNHKKSLYLICIDAYTDNEKLNPSIINKFININ